MAPKKTSRARRPIEPISIPSATHEHVVTSTTNASAGTLPSAGRKSRSSQPTPKPNAETNSPLAMNGSARPEKIASRFAGVASSGESVPNWRSFAIPIVIP